MPVGYMSNWLDCNTMQLDGVLSFDEYKKCLDSAIHGCKIAYEEQKKALHEKYFANGGAS